MRGVWSRRCLRLCCWIDPGVQPLPLSPASSFAGVDSGGRLHVAVGVAQGEFRTAPEPLVLSALSGEWKCEVRCVPQLLPADKSSPYPPLWWFAFSVPSPTLRYTVWRLRLEAGDTAWEVEKRAGFRDREVLMQRLAACQPFRSLMGSLSIRAARRELASSRPLLALHAWDPGIASEMLGKIPLRGEWGGLKLLFPENIPFGQRQEIESAAASLGFPHVEASAVPPRGRDVGGLVTLLREMGKRWDNRPCLYLHTKRSAHLPPCVSSWWRDRLMHPLTTPSGVARSLRRMRGGSALVYAKDCRRVEQASGSDGFPAASAALAAELGREIVSLEIPVFRFCAGTMMWIHPAETARVWNDDRLRRVLDRLEDSATMAEPSAAHAFERLFPQALESSGVRVSAI